MGHFGSSVALDATAEEAFGLLNNEEHRRAFMATVEPDETITTSHGDATATWFHVGAFHHRLDWHGSRPPAGDGSI